MQIFAVMVVNLGINIITVNAAVAYDSLQTRDMSDAYQPSHFDPLHEKYLLWSMQCYLNGVFVNDMPKFFLKNPMVSDHAVIILSVIDDSSLSILIMLQGATSYFPVWATTMSKCKSDVIPKFHPSAEAPMWDPGSSSYSLQEDGMMDFKGCIVSTVTTTRGHITIHVNTVFSSPFSFYCVINATGDKIFDTYLDSFVCISLTSTSRMAAVSHDKLSKHWGIYQTMCKGWYTMHDPEGCMYDCKSCFVTILLTIDHLLQYRCMHHQIFTDMMVSNTYLHWNNKCAQVVVSDFGWVHVYPMIAKGEGHKALFLMFQYEGLPLWMLMDGSKEMMQGKSHKKLVDTHCQLNQTEL